ncbi:Gfo/Idh/MocA family protein [Streptacidiphilus carbonis]|uniref:Gfo/Idh/MocA family protein n=1 Tax=Streptacidiphilus carbonis TaxID=105422 RepID=UPI0005A6F767|nr:Gfo/Idh/MocA family oxidoreductase [Streptacidiphilus carbonis]
MTPAQECSPVRLLIVGAGSRGSGYARYATATGRAVVTGFADPDPRRAADAAREHPEATAFADWRDLAAAGVPADAVVIATQDADHVEPALAFASAGLHILLEKPMATNEPDARRIVEAVRRSGVILAVCHVLRYTSYTAGVKALVDDGLLGDVIAVQHLEPVGWWHQAHSFVRGNWRREARAVPMLLAKSGHDLDWLSYIVGRPVRKVSSFGGLQHFRPENRPAGAADHCLDCPVEPDCPYSAPRLYLRVLAESLADDGGSGGGRADGGSGGRLHWPLSVVTAERTPAGVLDALRDSPYGRCVYTCDNDVVDHQVVNLEYEGGTTASFTMTAFTAMGPRRTRIFGSHGQLDGDGMTATVTDFRTGTSTVHDFGMAAGTDLGGHGDGDDRLVDAFLAAVSSGDRTLVRSDPETSLEAHLTAWAAERARHNSTVEYPWGV